VAVAKADIAKREGAPSSMPEVYATLLTKQQIRDVVEYLATLRTSGENSAAETAQPRALRGLPPAPKPTE
jgi:cytochrome c553